MSEGHDTPHPRVARKRLSATLEELVAPGQAERISVHDLLVALEGRAAAALLLIFALPNALPAPPGTSGILGLPLCYLSAQMMLGQIPWLPKFIAGRSMRREDLAALVARVLPMLMRVERMLVPRLMALAQPAAVRIAGGVCLALSVVLLLPIPFGNMLPALAICLIALGILERDGICLLIGGLVAVVSVVIVWGVLLALLRAALFLLGASGG